jgi:hypothetical protein
MPPPAKLGLWQSVKAYWYHLVPLWLFAPFVYYTLKYSHNEDSAWPWIFVVLFLVGIFFAIPFWRGRVGWSYQVLGGILYVFGGFAVVVIIELIRGRL